MGLPYGVWGSKRQKRTNDICGHLDRSHYAKGLCRACYRTTPEFAATRHRYYLANKSQFDAHTKKYRASGKQAKRLYGLLPVTYRRMVEMHMGICGLCQQPGGKKGLAVDHDHKTGRVRALLCSSCNMALGGFRDDPALCRRAAEYLEQWS